MNKFINCVLGFVLIVFAIMNCVLVRDLEEKTIELVEVYNTEPELIIVDSIEYDTIYIQRYDTIRLTKCQFDTITLNDTTIIIDSVDVILPIEYKRYNDTLSNTLISFDLQGYNCEIKDLSIQSILSVSTQEKPLKTKDFGVGLQLGIGATKDGFSPYIGIGISYNLFHL